MGPLLVGAVHWGIVLVCLLCSARESFFPSGSIHQPKINDAVGMTKMNDAKPLRSLSCGKRRPSRRLIHPRTVWSENLAPIIVPTRKPAAGER